MPRVKADECEYIDMEWYGVDRHGNIAVFCSGGEGNLPKFVCENAQRADELVNYFDGAEKTTSSVWLVSETTRDFSAKGLYYFDADDGTRLGSCTFHKYYTKHSYPQKPLKYEQLPIHIQEILKHHFMEIENFSLVNTIYVKHAYV